MATPEKGQAEWERNVVIHMLQWCIYFGMSTHNLQYYNIERFSTKQRCYSMLSAIITLVTILTQNIDIHFIRTLSLVCVL